MGPFCLMQINTGILSWIVNANDLLLSGSFDALRHVCETCAVNLRGSLPAPSVAGEQRFPSPATLSTFIPESGIQRSPFRSYSKRARLIAFGIRHRNRADEKQSADTDILWACRDGERRSKLILVIEEHRVVFRLP